MSWSVSAVGKPAAVAAKLAADFARITCNEPEASIKNNTATSIASALAAMPGSCAVQVEASGSQYVPDASKPEVAINTLSVKIVPLYGFVE